MYIRVLSGVVADILRHRSNTLCPFFRVWSSKCQWAFYWWSQVNYYIAISLKPFQRGSRIYSTQWNGVFFARADWLAGRSKPSTIYFRAEPKRNKRLERHVFVGSKNIGITEDRQKFHVFRFFHIQFDFIWSLIAWVGGGGWQRGLEPSLQRNLAEWVHGWLHVSSFSISASSVI